MNREFLVRENLVRENLVREFIVASFGTRSWGNLCISTFVRLPLKVINLKWSDQYLKRYFYFLNLKQLTFLVGLTQFQRNKLNRLPTFKLEQLVNSFVYF